MKFRLRKPEVVEAMLYTDSGGNAAEIIGWIVGNNQSVIRHGDVIWIVQDSGTRYVSPGDWIIRKADGEFTFCNSDEFDSLYEGVSDE